VKDDLTTTGPTDVGGRLEPTYDTDSVKWKMNTEALGQTCDSTELNITTSSMWRYNEFLPFRNPVTAGEADA
jgi:hypothetical protein